MLPISRIGNLDTDAQTYSQEIHRIRPFLTENTPFAQPSEQEFPFSANRDLPNRQTGNAQTGKQEFPFPADKIAEKGSLYIYKKHTEQQQQESSQSGKQAMPASGGCGGDVEIESTGQLRPYADQAKRRLDSSQLALGVRQDVADEWAARLGDTTQDTLRYPLRYLDTLIARERLNTRLTALAAALLALLLVAQWIA